MYYGHVPGIIILQAIWDGIPQLVGTVPLRTGTAVHVLFCFLPSRRFFDSLFCDHALDFRLSDRQERHSKFWVSQPTQAQRSETGDREVKKFGVGPLTGAGGLI